MLFLPAAVFFLMSDSAQLYVLRTQPNHLFSSPRVSAEGYRRYRRHMLATGLSVFPRRGLVRLVVCSRRFIVLSPTIDSTIENLDDGQEVFCKLGVP